LVSALIWADWSNRYDPVLSDLVTRKFAAIIGAFIVVALFRQAEGAVEFEAVGVKFKGAAGQFVLWLVCFLAIAAAIALLWRG
jgi:hypothetical protein